MDYLQSIIVGFMQGLTEFLPVSSSAHIVFSNAIYRIISGTILFNEKEEMFFDIVLHLGTLVAILIYFKNEILELLKAFFVAIKKRDFSAYEAKICLYIILGTIVTGIVALPLEDFIKKCAVESTYLVGLLLVVTGFVIFFSEKIAKKYSREGEKLNAKKSVFIGIAQGLAIFPGLSRSGLTIATGLACGLQRVKAAKYSFLLSLPIIFGVSLVFPIKNLNFAEMAAFNWGSIICGFFVSAITGYLCIKYFIYFLAKFSLNCFAYYCWIVGILAFIFFNPYLHIFG